MKHLITSLFFTFIAIAAYSQEMVTVSGKILDNKSNESLSGVTIYVPNEDIGTFSNEYGFYSLDVPKGKSISLVFSYLGYANQSHSLQIDANQVLNVQLGTEKDEEVHPSTTLANVVITSDGTVEALQEKVQSAQMSSNTVQMTQMRTLPAFLGEVDVIKIAQLLPGVSRGGEGGTNFFVRGGDADQNLVLLDEAVVYNPGHLFGFFSVFNSDAIKNFTITKGAFPANYGGRLSSVLDVWMKEGNMNKVKVDASVGLLSSKLTVQVPVIKNRGSIILSGRRTYVDKVLGAVGVELPYYFYDFNAKANFKLNDNNHLYFSSYIGDDILKIQGSGAGLDTTGNPLDVGFGYILGNKTQTLRWNHIFSPKHFSNLSLIHNNFRYDIQGQFAKDQNIVLQSRIDDWGLKYAFTYYPKNDLVIKYGTEITHHTFRPNLISSNLNIENIDSLLESKGGIKRFNLESAAYVNAEYDPNPRWKISTGVRLSSAIVQNKVYGAPEPRLGVRYSISADDAIKFGYSRMMQYMHRVSNSNLALPTDLWYPVSDKVKPQNSDQLTLSYQRVLKSLKATASIEGYYKWMRNLIEYQEGSNLILNNNFEDILVSGRGYSKGLEFLLKRDEGKLNGWIAYTLSWTQRQFDDLNGGKPFWAKYDRRNILAIVGNYEITPRFNLAAVWEYSTGARFTPIIGQYMYPNSTLSGIEIIPIYAERNSVKMSDSHRLDISMTYKGPQEGKVRWEFQAGAYNVYNRATPFRIRVSYNPQTGYSYSQPGLFGFLPFFNLNFQY